MATKSAVPRNEDALPVVELGDLLPMDHTFRL
jgi:hypothetical protein